MRKQNHKLIFGMIIILIGMLLLLNNLDLFNFDAEFWYGLVIVSLGIGMLMAYRENKSKKSALWLGVIFILIGLILILSSINLFSDDFLGVLVLWALGVLFASIYVQRNERWWAIIPAGLFFVLGAIVLIESLNILGTEFNGFIFLFGCGLVFWFLYLIQDEKSKFGWAGIVGMLLAILSFFVLSEEWDSLIADILFPVSIIFSGVYLIVRGIGKNQNEV